MIPQDHPFHLKEKFKMVPRYHVQFYSGITFKLLAVFIIFAYYDYCESIDLFSRSLLLSLVNWLTIKKTVYTIPQSFLGIDAISKAPKKINTKLNNLRKMMWSNVTALSPRHDKWKSRIASHRRTIPSRMYVKFCVW